MAFLLVAFLPVHAQVPTNGLIAYWPFSGNANDASGNGHNGSAYTPALVRDRFGVANRAYGFDGNDSIVVPDHADFRFAPEVRFSISLWVKYCSNARGNYWGILSKREGYLLVKGTSAIIEAISDAGVGRRTTSAQALDDGKWHHLVWVVADTVKVPANASREWMGFYVDGVSVDTDVFGNVSDFSTGTGDIIIGKYLNQSHPLFFYNGAIDDIRMYNRTLSATEVTALYNEGGWTPDTIPVNLSLIPVTSLEICPGDSARFDLATDADTLQWSTIDGLSLTTPGRIAASPEETTTYQVTAVKYGSSEPCIDSAVKTERITVTVLDPPKANAGNAVYTCSSDTVLLGGTTTGGTLPYQWRWSPTTGLNDPNVERPRAVVTGPNRYTVIVTDAKGCRDTAEVAVTVLPSSKIDLERDTIYSIGVEEAPEWRLDRKRPRGTIRMNIGGVRH